MKRTSGNNGTFLIVVVAVVGGIARSSALAAASSWSSTWGGTTIIVVVAVVVFTTVPPIEVIAVAPQEMDQLEAEEANAEEQVRQQQQQPIGLDPFSDTIESWTSKQLFTFNLTFESNLKRNSKNSFAIRHLTIFYL